MFGINIRSPNAPQIHTNSEKKNLQTYIQILKGNPANLQAHTEKETLQIDKHTEKETLQTYKHMQRRKPCKQTSIQIR